VANWVDSKGSKIRNWKQKMINVWFKDENKTTTKKTESNSLKITDEKFKAIEEAFRAADEYKLRADFDPTKIRRDAHN
jgi:nitric oxide reductase large subunit